MYAGVWLILKSKVVTFCLYWFHVLMTKCKSFTLSIMLRLKMLEVLHQSWSENQEIIPVYFRIGLHTTCICLKFSEIDICGGTVLFCTLSNPTKPHPTTPHPTPPHPTPLNITPKQQAPLTQRSLALNYWSGSLVSMTKFPRVGYLLLQALYLFMYL